MKKEIKSGIYKIKNIKNNEYYIGSTINLVRRWSQHKSRLKYNTHHSIILQRAWNKYGKDSFIFEIIEECDPEFLFEKEQNYIDTFNPKYNVGLNACGGDNLTNNPNRQEIIQKMTESLKKRFLEMTDDEKKLRSEACKGIKNSNFGNKWSDDARKSLSEKKKKYYENNSPINKNKKLEDVIGEEKATEIKKNYLRMRLKELVKKILSLENHIKKKRKMNGVKKDSVNTMDNKIFLF